MDETLITIFLAIIGQCGLLIAVMVQNASIKTSIEDLKKWRDGIDDRFRTLELEHAENHGRPARHD